MAPIRAGIVGGAGYTGGEMIRLLLNHPSVLLSFVQSRSQAGQPLYATHHDLAGETELTFAADIDGDVDVIFLCLGHGESRKFVTDVRIPDHVRLVDLSQDFRLGESAGGRHFIYGLPEANRDAIRGASNIANPGCFATAIQLGLLPLAKAGVLGEVYSTGITGSTGAGQKLQDTTHFTWRANNISAYKTLSHQHMNEVARTLRSWQSDAGAIHFVPWRGDFARGIYVSSTVRVAKFREDVFERYREYYAQHPFVVVRRGTVDMKQVINTNKCILGVEQEGEMAVIHTAIDNLLKGASGQAVQNMNLLFGEDETAGLRLKSIVF